MQSQAPNIQASQNVSFGDSSSSAPTYITPDCLLAYCSSRLQNLDSQMQQQFVTQQANIADGNKLQQFEQNLKDVFTNEGKDGEGKLSQDTNLDAATVTTLQDQANLISDPTARAAADAALSGLQHMKQGQTFDDFKSCTLDGLDSAQQSLSQGQELGMIGLQSIMSARQTAIQMTTNLMQSIGDQMKSVAENVGK